MKLGACSFPVIPCRLVSVSSSDFLLIGNSCKKLINERIVTTNAFPLLFSFLKSLNSWNTEKRRPFPSFPYACTCLSWCAIVSCTYACHPIKHGLWDLRLIVESVFFIHCVNWFVRISAPRSNARYFSEAIVRIVFWIGHCAGNCLLDR